jgi:hypothetical protein
MWIFEHDERAHLPINDVAEKIWKDKRYRKAVSDKSRKAHDRGELCRLPPLADAIYIPMDQAIEYLEKFCHRDDEAKKQLRRFDFQGLEDKVRGAIDRKFDNDIQNLHQKIEDSHREIEVKKRKREEMLNNLAIKKSKTNTMSK